LHERIKMKISFIGTGRMGQAMVRRLLSVKHDVGIFNRTPAKAKLLEDAGATVLGSIKEAADYGSVVFTMLADDVALEEVVFQGDGLLASLRAGCIHICSGTHGIAALRKLNAAYAQGGQVLIAAPILGRPELVTSGNATVVASGDAEAIGRCQPLFDAIGRRTFHAGTEPEAAAAAKIANNFVLGCAIEAMGEGYALVRKYGVDPSVFFEVMTDSVFGCVAYHTYGKIIRDATYSEVGYDSTLGLKDANLALNAGELAGVPLPSGSIWRDRLIGAIAHGDNDKDWAVMALEQARASGLI
jgi:3-hydroxyisobutyrate dehydrogenase-like beta-hydroxyacid dehydrogenase